MSDHVDGPRTTADPSVDLSDLYAFTSPADPARMVFVACAFPFAGETALFSNAVNYSIAVRRVGITGIGSAAGFKSQDPEIRFTFQFEVLRPGTDETRPAQTGACILPDGTKLAIAVNDEQGVSTPDSSVRLYAGLRSDHFFIGWRPDRELTKVTNLLNEDNVLTMVVEIDTARILPVSDGTLFGVICETTPRDPKPYVQTVPRFDWVGRPEQTNFRFNVNPDLQDIRDLWNQETPFAISAETLPVYRERLMRSFERWDSFDGKADWSPAAMAANVSVFLEDYLIFDVAKPITDGSHLEIEKSVIDGKPHATGGGRTLDANVIDILVTWLVNHDRGPLMQSATEATQRGGKAFPYAAPPNRTPLVITTSVDLMASPRDVWALVGRFDGPWFPLVTKITTEGTGIGQLRYLSTVDGRVIIERLTGLDDSQMKLTYELVTGLPAEGYEATIEVKPKGQGSSVTWSSTYRPDGVANVGVNRIINRMQAVNLNGLKARFGSAP